MAISTYTELQAAVASWIERADLAERIPEFIALVEAKLNRDLRCSQMEKRSYTTVNTASSEPEFVSLPSDFQTMRRIRLSGVAGKPHLENVTQLQANDIRSARRNTVGQPYYYTLSSDEIELVPTPDSDYELEMTYRSNIPPLASNATNWLLTIAPDVYLYGSLLEAGNYLTDEKRVQSWAAGFSMAVDGVNKIGLERAFYSGPGAVIIEGPCP